MEFNRSIVSNFEGSFDFLSKSLSNSCEFLNKKDVKSANKWQIQVDVFLTVIDMIKKEKVEDSKMHPIEGLKNNIMYPIFQEHSTMLTSPIIEDDVVRDSFIKIPKTDSSKELPRGIKIEFGKYCLPVSEIYTEMVTFSINNKDLNTTLPIRILLGFFSTIYHTITLKEDSDTLILIKENIDKLVEYIESNEVANRRQTSSNPMDMIQKALGGMDMSKISDMFNRVSGNGEASKEFDSVLSKMSDGMKSGKPFTDVMGDLVKDVSLNASNENYDQDNDTAQEQADTEPEQADVASVQTENAMGQE
jgi:hypothetical protein